jgi:hypothetical protein
MTPQERYVVNSEPVETAPVVTEAVPASNTVVEPRTVQRTVITDDPVGNAYAASHLIETIVFSVVVLVLLVVALVALHVYAGLF